MGLVMRKARILVGLALLCACLPALASPEQPLSSLRAIHALTNAQAGHQLPVSFQGTVVYYRDYERTLFVQDGEVGIYVQPRNPVQLAPGDRVLVEGTTHESFRPFVASANITLLRHDALPRPARATYDQLIRADFDCRLITVRAVIRSADLVLSSDVPSISIQMRTDGGAVDAVVDSSDIAAVKRLLDSEIDFTGAVSGHFDGKMQVTGILLHANSLSAIKVIKAASKDPWDLPVTHMDEVLSAYHVNNTSQRVRVHGTITYYQPGSAVVLQSGSRSIWIMTHDSEQLNVGDQAEAIGFPGLHDGFLTLMGGDMKDSKIAAPVTPRSVTWSELATSHYLFDLVTTEGVVVAENRGAAQDEYVLDSGGSLFSAIYRHPAKRSTGVTSIPAMKQIALGSKVRVTGICLMGASNPFDSQVPFDILMRSPADIATIAAPSWLNVVNLTRIIGVLLVMVLVVAAWGWTLLAKVKSQTAAITAN